MYRLYRSLGCWPKGGGETQKRESIKRRQKTKKKIAAKREQKREERIERTQQRKEKENAREAGDGETSHLPAHSWNILSVSASLFSSVIYQQPRRHAWAVSFGLGFYFLQTGAAVWRNTQERQATVFKEERVSCDFFGPWFHFLQTGAAGISPNLSSFVIFILSIRL